MVKFGYRPLFKSIVDEVLANSSSVDDAAIYKPAANVRENEAGFEIELALPGFEKEEINLKLEKEQLTISAGNEKSDAEKNSDYSWSEFRRSVKFKRTFLLPENIDPEAIRAEYRNGILYITVPRKDVQPSVSKEITIA